MKNIVYIVAVLSLCLNGYLLFKPEVEKTVYVEKRVEVASEPEIVTVTEVDQELEQKYAKALEEIERYKKELDSKENELIAYSDSDGESTELAQNKVAEMSYKELSDEELDKKIMAKYQEDKKIIEDAFANEELDPIWGYQTQDLINAAIQKHGDLTKYSTENLQCKTNVCKMTIKPYTQNQSSAISAGMNASFSFHSNEALRDLGSSFSMNEEHSEVEMFIWKKELTDGGK
ncbi:MAG: hypothetical protein HWD86_01805 [Kangiellaceae bacterium]|nr:hypothetical protein [Kangiellaceae bacterium]